MQRLRQVPLKGWWSHVGHMIFGSAWGGARAHSAPTDFTGVRVKSYPATGRPPDDPPGRGTRTASRPPLAPGRAPRRTSTAQPGAQLRPHLVGQSRARRQPGDALCPRNAAARRTRNTGSGPSARYGDPSFVAASTKGTPCPASTSSRSICSAFRVPALPEQRHHLRLRHHPSPPGQTQRRGTRAQPHPGRLAALRVVHRQPAAAPRRRVLPPPAGSGTCTRPQR